MEHATNLKYVKMNLSEASREKIKLVLLISTWLLTHL